jgi:hypothetical protein
MPARAIGRVPVQFDFMANVKYGWLDMQAAKPVSARAFLWPT